VANVDMAVGVGEGGGDEQAAGHKWIADWRLRIAD
jgi:hypothetical protein